MKMSKKGAIAIALALCIAFACMAAALAAFTVTSDPILVKNTYTVSIVETGRSFSAVAFLATVTSNGPSVEGIPVSFQYSVNGADWTVYQIQNIGGNAGATTGTVTCTYTLTTNGDIYFRAVAVLA